MTKILIKYSFVFFFLVGGGVVLADTPSTLPSPVSNPNSGYVPPPGLACCDELYNNTGDIEAYEECKNSPNPAAYCPLPVDNSIYIYISIVAGVTLASFVIARRMKI